MRIKRLETFQQKLKLIPWDKRLRLSHLPQPIRRYAGQVVAVALTSCLIILLFGLGLYPFETTVELPESLSPIHDSLFIPFSLVLLLIVGWGLLARALYYASYQPGWVLPRLTRLLIGLIGLALPLEFVSDSLQMAVEQEGGVWMQILLMLQFVFVLIALACGCAAVVCAFVQQPARPHWAARFAMGSYFGMALVFLLLKPWWDFLARQNETDPGMIPSVQIPIWHLVNYAMPMVWIIGIIFFWQAVVEAKLFSREIGLAAARLTSRVPWLLTALFALKGVWLLSGYVNASRSGQGEPWIGSLDDGAWAWLLAFLFALATGWWLLRRRTPVDPRHLMRGALLLTLGFLLPFLVAFLLWIFASLARILVSDAIGLRLATISSDLAGFGLAWSIGFVILLLPLGFIALRLRKLRESAPIVLLTGLWSLPFLVRVVFPDSKLSFDYLTFDTALTAILFGLLVLEWGWKLHRIQEWMITIILVVSTLMALVENLLLSDETLIGFALLLILPMVYQLFFDSEELNRPEPAQGQRVIRTIGFQGVLMLIIAWAVTLGLMKPGQELWEDVATRVFLPPFLLLYLTNTIAHYENISLNNSD